MDGDASLTTKVKKKVTTKKKKKKKVVLSASERRDKKIKSDHRQLVRAVFSMTGFERINKLSDKEFDFKGQRSDFDDVFVYENIVVCAEYTTTSSVSSHLKPKKIVYDKIDLDHGDFLDHLRSMSSEFTNSDIHKYANEEIILRILYCSLHSVDSQLKLNVDNPIYFDYPVLRYFQNLTNTIRVSARPELFDFLDIPHSALGRDGKIFPDSGARDFHGLLLHENNSHFGKGFRVVSFYADPDSLLMRSYVLRKDGWKKSSNLYQRMLSKSKIDAIRKHLKTNKRVFINNVIATLPAETKFLDRLSDTIPPEDLKKSEPVRIQLPNISNSIGLIDGQHRTFSYYEDKKERDDPEIASLRGKQNLLVTGIVYPKNISNDEREKFEATLFLEINSNQTGAKSTLKQAIGLVLTPFTPDSIATRVLSEIDVSTGPLSRMFERYDFEKDKIKTSSIISYALRPLVKPSGADSLFAIWDHPNKSGMVSSQDHSALNDYVAFCVREINTLLSATKSVLPYERWTTEKKVEGRFLTTLNINSVLILLRRLIENGQVGSVDKYRAALVDFASFDTSPYHSSHYNKMADDIYSTYFATQTLP